MDNTQQATNKTQMHYIRLTPAESDIIRRLAEQNMRTMASELRMAVREYLEKNAGSDKYAKTAHQ